MLFPLNPTRELHPYSSRRSFIPKHEAPKISYSHIVEHETGKSALPKPNHETQTFLYIRVLVTAFRNAKFAFKVLDKKAASFECTQVVYGPVTSD